MRFFCPVTPTAKGRPRFGKGRVYTPEKTVKATNALGLFLGMHRPRSKSGPIWLGLRFVMPLPASSPRRDLGAPHVVKPDLDNLVKLVMDAMTKDGKWWGDDSQVYCVHAEKRYQEKGEAHGIWIEHVAVEP